MHNGLRCVLLALTLFSLPAIAGAPAPSATLSLKNAERTVTLTREQLSAMPHVTVSMPIHGAAHVFEGVPLTLLLQRVSAPVGEALHGDALAQVVVITARDGYVAILALAETDASVRKDAVILADRVDGAPIPQADGPYRLVVVGDLRPARSVKMVESVEVRSLKTR